MNPERSDDNDATPHTWELKGILFGVGEAIIYTSTNKKRWQIFVTDDGKVEATEVKATEVD
jgi:hypothetical protein